MFGTYSRALTSGTALPTTPAPLPYYPLTPPSPLSPPPAPIPLFVERGAGAGTANAANLMKPAFTLRASVPVCVLVCVGVCVCE